MHHRKSRPEAFGNVRASAIDSLPPQESSLLAPARRNFTHTAAEKLSHVTSERACRHRRLTILCAHKEGHTFCVLSFARESSESALFCDKVRPQNLPKSSMLTVFRRREIMKRLVTRLCAVALAVCALAVVRAQMPGARFTVQEMLRIQRVADPQLSPDGHWIAYQITVPDVAANRSRTQIYLIGTGGGEPKQLTSGATSSSE